MRRCSASPRSTTRSFPWSMRSVFSTRGKAPSGGWRCATRGTIAPTMLPSSGSASKISWKTTLHNLLDALILGIVEGLTEFLPVSSTGHLTITEKLLGLRVDAPGVTAYTAVIQLGAILATLLYFRKDIVRLLRAWAAGLGSAQARAHHDYQLAWAVIVGSIP